MLVFPSRVMLVVRVMVSMMAMVVVRMTVMVRIVVKIVVRMEVMMMVLRMETIPTHTNLHCHRTPRVFSVPELIFHLVP